jgi:lambda repressor-like predicted transcriptional regulator/predicted RNA-binding Zn-ribbon protein involved in translation (DUF1610 family)
MPLKCDACGFLGLELTGEEYPEGIISAAYGTPYVKFENYKCPECGATYKVYYYHTRNALVLVGEWKRCGVDTYEWIVETHFIGEYRKKLRALLKEKGISQAEFARRCGCSASNISAILGERYGQRCPKYIWVAARQLTLLPN